MKHTLFYNRGNFFQYFSSLAGTSLLISSGVNFGWTSPYLPKLQAADSSIPTTSEEGAWCAVAVLLGFPGAIIAAILVDKIGRKHTILLMAPILSAGYVGIAFARSIWTITALRFVMGGADSVLFTALPIYVAEISDPKARGFLSTTAVIATIIGTLFINIIGPLMNIFTSSLICALIPVMHFVSFVLMPDSPYYYLKKGRVEDAKESLKILRGQHDVNQELAEISEAVARQERATEKSSLQDLFIVPSNRKALLISVIVNGTNRLSGKSPCVFYTETIFRESSSGIDASVSVVVYTLVELIAVVIVSLFIVDRFGKKVLLVISSAGCAVSVFMLSLNFFLKDFYPKIAVHVTDWLPITALILYNIFFSAGLSFGSLSVLGELFPTSVKANASCIGEILANSLGVVASKFFQITTDKFGTMALPFFCFSMCCVVGLVFIIKYLPETKGKTLEEIQRILIGDEQYLKETNKTKVTGINDSSI